MVDPLLDDVLVFWVVGVNDSDCLPAAPALGRIGTLEGEAGQQRGEGSSLCVHTGLHEFLWSTKVSVAVHHDP